MRPPLALDGLTKIFETERGAVTAVQGVTADLQAGEFVSLLGHPGCGKSTVLSIVAGLESPTGGGVLVDGAEVRGPGPERAVVFATPSLLPWMTARQNVRLAVDRACAGTSGRERGELVERYLDLLGVGDVADARPGELARGTQQRVALARAMAVCPRVLLLDDPFSMLDSMTRFELQDLLVQVWDEEPGRVVIMVTTDIDEALYLSDRLLLMTHGPAARIGEAVRVPFPRPRTRASVLGHARYAGSRAHVLAFLARHARQSRAS